MRRAGRQIVYVDETWVNVNIQPSKEWTSQDSGRKTPIGSGQRIIILHAGGEDGGFVEGCDAVFTSVHVDGRDYHSEVNSDVFEDWLKTRLLPSLPQPSCIIMDNARYHSVIHPEYKAPSSSSRKKRHNQVARP